MRAKPHCQRKPQDAINFHLVSEAIDRLWRELRDKADRAQVKMDEAGRRLSDQEWRRSNSTTARQQLFLDGLIYQHTKARKEELRMHDTWNLLDRHHRRLIELMGLLRRGKIK